MSAEKKALRRLGLSWGDDLHPSPTQGWAPVSPASAVALRPHPPPLSAFVSTLTSIPVQVLGKNVSASGWSWPRADSFLPFLGAG